MKEQLQKHQGTASWSAAVMALALFGSEVVDFIKDKDGIQDQQDQSIMQGMGEKHAAYIEWKGRTVTDMRALEAQVMHCRESIAGLTATVDMLTSKHGGKVDRALEEVKTYIAKPLPASADMVIDLDEEDLGVAPSRRPAPNKAKKRKRFKSKLRSGDKVVVNQEQVQQHIKEMFR